MSDDKRIYYEVQMEPADNPGVWTHYSVHLSLEEAQLQTKIFNRRRTRLVRVAREVVGVSGPDRSE